MAKETRRIVTVAAATIALASIGAGFQGTTWDTGETRELINQPACRTGDVAKDGDRCDFLALNPERE
jgi:hypothetical protein